MPKSHEHELQSAIASHLTAHDAAGAVQEALDAIRRGALTIPDLYVNVLGPLLEGIGDEWARGTERVWEEHLASQAVRTIIESLHTEVHAQAADSPRKHVKVLLACPPKEQHDIGLRMLADRFELGGYDAVFLGADTPIEEIVSAALATGASLVALSVSTAYERVVLRTYVEQLRSRLPGVRIAVGGPAFQPDEHWPAEDFLDTAELDLPGSPEAR